MDESAASAYRRHYGRVYRFVRRRAGSAQEAEDITQEVFEAALAALADQRLSGEPELAWLYTVAERRLIRTWRRRVRAEPLDDGGSDQVVRSTELYGPRASEVVMAGVRRLPEGQQRVVILKLFQRRRFSDIASELGISEEACRMRLSRALAALREHLTAEGVEP